MGVNKYASTFPMASCNKKACNQRRKKIWRKKIQKYVTVFASMQLRITRLRKYPIDPKAYLGRFIKVHENRHFQRKSVNIFLHIMFRMFWVLKRIVSLRRFF